ncbi:MAG: hypothetical protein LBM93_06060 [Oscillospiraceae bacterium]|jgi:hypothetical protein|nr:hypothetical protein [Oscillospiraceae bacterium]
MIDIINLPFVLEQNEHKLKGAKIYGKIVKTLTQYEVLDGKVTLLDSADCFAVIDCVCIDLCEHKEWLQEQGVWNKTGFYFLNGEIGVYVGNANVSLGKFVSVKGTVRLKKFVNSEYPIVNMLNYAFMGDNLILHKAYLREINFAELPKKTRFAEYLQKSIENNTVILPEEARELVQFWGYKPDILSERILNFA